MATSGLPAELDIDPNSDFNKTVVDRAFLYIVGQLRALKAYKPDWQEQVDLLREIGLVRLNDTILPIYNRLASIAQLGTLFTTSSTTSLPLNKGPINVQVSDNDKARFAATAYLTMVNASNPAQYMSGLMQSYDRDAGVLALQIDTVVGTGTFSNWIIYPGAANTQMLQQVQLLQAVITLGQTVSGQIDQKSQAVSDALAQVLSNAQTVSSNTNEVVDLAEQVRVTAQQVNSRLIVSSLPPSGGNDNDIWFMI